MIWMELHLIHSCRKLLPILIYFCVNNNTGDVNMKCFSMLMVGIAIGMYLPKMCSKSSSMKKILKKINIE